MFSTSYENFQESYCSEIATATKMLCHLKKSTDTDLKEKCIDGVSKTYDTLVVDYIKKCIDINNNRNKISMNEITDVALNNMNRNGTEMKMILYAIEDIYRSFCRHIGEDMMYEFCSI